MGVPLQAEAVCEQHTLLASVIQRYGHMYYHFLAETLPRWAESHGVPGVWCLGGSWTDPTFTVTEGAVWGLSVGGRRLLSSKQKIAS